MFNFYIGLVSVTLPTITEYYHADVMTATWISNIYFLTLTVSVIFLDFCLSGLSQKMKNLYSGLPFSVASLSPHI
jgi:MFS family permease